MSEPDRQPRPDVAPVSIERHEGDVRVPVDDFVAVEEPLEIRIEGRSISVVMRTPGHDEELVAGFLLAENVARSPADIFEISPCPAATGNAKGNVIDVLLTKPGGADLRRLTRGVITSSSCGTCGKTSIDDVHLRFPPFTEKPAHASAALMQRLPDEIAKHQEAFRSTGGLHAAALFRFDGTLVYLREDVGRHNAVDKVLGRALLDGTLPLEQSILFVSGRISFEIVQKALAARVPVVAGISAPTSLAVEFARASGQTLAGFVRSGRLNLYAGALT